MKTLSWAVLTAVLPLTCLPAGAQSSNSNNSNNEAIPSLPVGVLTANPTNVQAGTKTKLAWSIVYPSAVEDVATISPPGSIVLEEPLFVSVRPVGVGPTECRSSTDKGTINAEARLSVNGSSFVQLFYGTNDDVDPSTSLYIKRLGKGSTINFGGRFVKNGSWTPFYTTRSSNFQIIALVDGDAVPTTFDLNGSGKLASYLEPYINKSTGKISLSPLNLLILMELAETNHESVCYDYQDMVLMVTFSQNHPNNGHGNNLDGVDSSNPGQGSGGPNGQVDESFINGGVDDEIR